MPNAKNRLHNIRLSYRKNENEAFLNCFATHFDPAVVEFVAKYMAHPVDALYDAYEKDIAMVQIYFKKSTIFEMGSQPRMNWIDYLSTVGGLLGLIFTNQSFKATNQKFDHSYLAK